ncbi:MAG: Fis family transcriptional regulator [Cyanobacteria bacterium P01_D01_bin.44]
MTSNLDDIAHRRFPSSATEAPTHPDPAEFALDATMRDRFELLSAYLDGEVTPGERRQVARWLSEDSRAQALYHRLLSLRQAMRAMPIESPEISSNFATDIAFRAVCQRVKIASLAIACTASAIILSSTNSLMNPLLRPLQGVFSNYSGAPNSEALEIVLDEPAIELRESLTRHLHPADGVVQPPARR